MCSRGAKQRNNSHGRLNFNKNDIWVLDLRGRIHGVMVESGEHRTSAFRAAFGWGRHGAMPPTASPVARQWVDCTTGWRSKAAEGLLTMANRTKQMQACVIP